MRINDVRDFVQETQVIWLLVANFDLSSIRISVSWATFNSVTVHAK